MRTKTGTVTSTKMEKTIVITVHTYKQHAKYKKKYRTTKTFTAHDENEISKEGDEVTIRESRPLSKTKRWTILEVNGKKVAEEQTETTVKES
jgi:small subunit ribosomal protein S17